MIRTDFQIIYKISHYLVIDIIYQIIPFLNNHLNNPSLFTTRGIIASAPSVPSLFDLFQTRCISLTNHFHHSFPQLACMPFYFVIYICIVYVFLTFLTLLYNRLYIQTVPIPPSTTTTTTRKTPARPSTSLS